jgi:hypothetical protein
MNIADSLPIAYRVRAVDRQGIVQYSQEFHFRVDFDAQAVANKNADRIRKLFDDCMVTVDPLTFEDLKR